MTQKLIVETDQASAEYLLGDDCFVNDYTGYLELHFHRDRSGRVNIKEVYTYFKNIDSRNPLKTFVDKTKVVNFGSDLDMAMVRKVLELYEYNPPATVKVQLDKLKVGNR